MSLFRKKDRQLVSPASSSQDLRPKKEGLFKSGLRQVGKAASAAFDEGINKTIGNVGRGIVSAITSPITSRQAASESQRLADQALQQQKQAASLQKSGNYRQSQQKMNQGTRSNVESKGLDRSMNTYYNKRASDSFTGGLKTLLSAGGLAAGAKALVGAAGAGGTLGGGINYATGGDVAEGVGRGIGDAPQLAGLNKITAPFFDKALGYAGSPGKAKTLLKRAPMAGMLNLGEDEFYTRATELRAPTNAERAYSFGAGALTSPFIKIDEKAISKPMKKYIRDAQGKFARFAEDLKTVFYGEDLDKIASKNNLQLEQVSPRKFKVTKPDSEEALGALLGIEITQDENGEWQVDFNPQSAALGVGAMAIGNKLPPTMFSRR